MPYTARVIRPERAPACRDPGFRNGFVHVPATITTQPTRTTLLPAKARVATVIPAVPQISLQGVQKTYPNGTVALRDVSLEIPKQDFVFLVGPSGAGKSTLVRLLIREEKATAGSIHIEGQDLSRLKRRHLPYLRRKIGMVFQDFKLLPNLTVFQNVAFALRVTEGALRHLKPKVEEVLSIVGLEGPETRMREGTMHRLWNRIDFAFSSAWQNFWRNAAVSIASVLIVWVVLLALGSLLLVLHSLDQIVAREKTKASAISVYLADTTPLSSAMDFKLHLESDPRVSSVTYVSKDQAMARFRQLPALDPSVIDTVGTNPLPASLDVTVKDIRDLAAIDQEVRTSPLVDKSPATNYEPNVIDKTILLAPVAGIAGLVLIIGLTGLSVFIIMLTIRTAIYLRRKEIEVMKLVGATDWFVRWPFIVEGLIVGVVGAVVAALLGGFGS